MNIRLWKTSREKFSGGSMPSSQGSFLSWRHLVCISLIVIFPISLSAQEASGALLRSNAIGVTVNKSSAPGSIALFRNDLIETQNGAATRIESAGSTTDINAGSMVQFEGDELVLDHGSVSVNTSRGLRVRVGCLTVTPVNAADWTHYDVLDRDGKVTVSATKSDVYLDAHSNNLQQAKKSTQSDRSVVRETEQKSRDENCGAADPKKGAGSGGTPGPWLNNPWVVGGAGVAIVAGACIALCRSEDPISPSNPSGK
jgi:hypothetical protein